MSDHVFTLVVCQYCQSLQDVTTDGMCAACGRSIFKTLPELAAALQRELQRRNACGQRVHLLTLSAPARGDAMTPRPRRKPERRCSQCGRTFRAKPCGFAHATIGRWRPAETP
jgi:DNA-directed RNA polymerase subunit RPC12/RpoP